MRLDKFVEESLVQVCRGLAAAGPEVQASGGAINPRPTAAGEQKLLHSEHRLITNVEFDVAVTVGKSGKGTIEVPGLGLGIGFGRTSSTVNRIKFVVPMVLPRSSRSGETIGSD